MSKAKPEAMLRGKALVAEMSSAPRLLLSFLMNS